MDAARGHSLGMIVASTLSSAGSLGIIVAYLTIFRSELSKITSVVFYVAVSNLLTSLGSLVGEPVDGSFACFWEGFVTNVFTLSSIYWCTIISHILDNIVCRGRSVKLVWQFHAIAWGIPTLVTFLPYVNASYGSPGGLGWCFIVPNSDGSTPGWAVVFWFW
jgi:hypothetical protein